MATDIQFFPRVTIEQVEEGRELAPKFDEHGLLPCVTTAAHNGEVLMHGYMNAEALKKTILTGEAHYFSRSRQVIWHKRSEEHTSELQSLMRISSAVFCLKKK